MYTRLMETIYLFLRTQVAEGTFFIKSPVVKKLTGRDRQPDGTNELLRLDALLRCMYSLYEHKNILFLAIIHT